MNRYLSATALYIRWNLSRICGVILVTALLAGFLLYHYPAGEVQQSYSYPDGQIYQAEWRVYLVDAVKESGVPVACAIGFTAAMVLMSLTGCGYGTKPGYTVQRLRVKEKYACLLWSGYHAALLIVFWAVLASLLYLLMCLRSRDVPSGYVLGPQTLVLLCYTDTFLHHLLPLADTAVWVENVALILASALGTVHFSYRQRHGGISIAPLLAAGCMIGSFFLPLGSNLNFVVMAAALVIAGWTLVSFFSGGEEDAA